MLPPKVYNPTKNQTMLSLLFRREVYKILKSITIFSFDAKREKVNIFKMLKFFTFLILYYNYNRWCFILSIEGVRSSYFNLKENRLMFIHKKTVCY